jgi:hypothetical protein
MKKCLISFCLVMTVIQSHGQGFSPTTEYKDFNRDKWTIEIPEVQELIHIIIAISPIGKNDMNMVQHKTEYYHAVVIIR